MRIAAPLVLCTIMLGLAASGFASASAAEPEAAELVNSVST